MRIFYAADNREGSYYQLLRYLPFLRSKKNTTKIAGFKKSLKNLNADYCLDALLDFRNPNGNLSFNGNFSLFSREINKFKPDLIISDFEIYSSILGIDKGIKVWQCSPVLLYYAIDDNLKRDIGIHKYNYSLISKDRIKYDYIKNIIKNSDKKIVLSHLCDLENKPKLLDSFEWCRPEFNLSSELDISVGIETELSDLFYNEKYALIKQDKDVDIEKAIGTAFTLYYKLGQLMQDPIDIKNINISLDEDVKFLMEMI